MEFFGNVFMGDDKPHEHTDGLALPDSFTPPPVKRPAKLPEHPEYQDYRNRRLERIRGHVPWLLGIDCSEQWIIQEGDRVKIQNEEKRLRALRNAGLLY